ncbi:MAG: hypothetical protein PVJ27_00105 [Candidatus Brocadiaceae bacterium]|jgi:collagenase-like PrtC family protease
MQFSVGYQLSEPGEESLLEVVRDFADRIDEVYFPWADMPSGRAAMASRRGYTDWTAQRRLEEDLRAFREMGIRLNLLFNANCYGGRAASQWLEQKVLSALDYLHHLVDGVDAVTTTSLLIARTVRRNFPEVDVRASVNMRIDTVQAMAYVGGLFDSYYVRREYNRDLEHLRRLKAWADRHGKRIHLLVNSGCLAFCSGQTFHDNLVAHEQEVDETRNVPDWTPHVCWNYLEDPVHWPAILQASWVRPEDLHHYEEMFGQVKLATRMHARPRMVVHAYAGGRHRGNLLDLLEPGFSPAVAPHIVDNERFPEDWFERTSSCRRRCEECDYCGEVLRKVLVRAPGA